MLKDKIALITGASRGIGRQIAISMAKQGAAVIVNYNGSREAAEKVVDTIAEAGGRAEMYACDVSDYEAVAGMFQYITDKYNRLDILVNNAGITRDGLMLKMTEEDFSKVIDINLKGTFYCMKHSQKMMLRQRSGRIINLASVVGLHGNAGQANYAASKAGIIGLTKAAAKEVAGRGITVNAIAPGYIDTDMTQVLSDTVREKVIAQVPLGRMGNVNDIADTAVFLASDMASYITGQVISVDGGMSI